MTELPPAVIRESAGQTVLWAVVLSRTRTRTRTRRRGFLGDADSRA